MVARYERIADELRDEILTGVHPVGAQLPSEAELAERHRAARGDRAAGGGRPGGRGPGRIPAGSQAHRARQRAQPELRRAAQLRPVGARQRLPVRGPGDAASTAGRRAPPRPPGSAREEVLDVLRLRSLEGEPVLLERTVYAHWIAPAVEALPPDCESVTEALYDSVGLVFAYGEHLIDAVSAGAQDARLARAYGAAAPCCASAGPPPPTRAGPWSAPTTVTGRAAWPSASATRWAPTRSSGGRATCASGRKNICSIHSKHPSSPGWLSIRPEPRGEAS